MDKSYIYANADVIGIELNSTEKERVEKVLEVINNLSIESVLDVGCGDGRITNIINKPIVVGTDFSESALELVKKEKKLSTLPNLPFENESFDLVLCTEVLEHLDEEIYFQVITELARISRKYLLLTFPYNEVLIASNTKCNFCGNVFNKYHHVRSYDKKELAKLDKMLDSFKVVLQMDIGAKVGYMPKWYYHLRQNVLGKYDWWSGCVCENCGSKNQTKPKAVNSIPKYALGFALNITKSIWKLGNGFRHKWHYLVMYEKK